MQYNILKREADTNKQLYDGMLQKLKEAGITAGLRSSQYSRRGSRPDSRRTFAPE